MRSMIARIVTTKRKHRYKKARREAPFAGGACKNTRPLHCRGSNSSKSSIVVVVVAKLLWDYKRGAVSPLHPDKIMSQGRQEFAMLLPGTGNGGNVSALIGIRWHERSPSAARLSSIRPSQVEDRVLIRLVLVHRSSFSCRLQLRFDKSGNSSGWCEDRRIEKFLYEFFKLDINSGAREREDLSYSIWFLSSRRVAENWSFYRETVSQFHSTIRKNFFSSFNSITILQFWSFRWRGNEFNANYFFPFSFSVEVFHT